MLCLVLLLIKGNSVLNLYHNIWILAIGSENILTRDSSINWLLWLNLIIIISFFFHGLHALHELSLRALVGEVDCLRIGFDAIVLFDTYVLLCYHFSGSASPMLSNQDVSDGSRLVKDLTSVRSKPEDTGMYMLPLHILFSLVKKSS